MKRVRVGNFQASQPNDAGHYWIAPGRVRLKNLTSPASIVKDSADWRPVADLLRDLQQTERGCEAAPRIAQSIF